MAGTNDKTYIPSPAEIAAESEKIRAGGYEMKNGKLHRSRTTKRAQQSFTIPDPPLLVLARPLRSREAHWYHIVNTVPTLVPMFARCGYVTWVKAKDLTPVDHPRNDAAALQIIQDCKAISTD